MSSVSSASRRVDKDRAASIDGSDNLDELNTLSASENLAQSPTLSHVSSTIPDKDTLMLQRKTMREKRLAALDRKAEEATREEAEKRERIRARLEKLDLKFTGIKEISSVSIEDSASSQSTVHNDKPASSLNGSSSSAFFNDLIRREGKKDNEKQRKTTLTGPTSLSAAAFLKSLDTSTMLEDVSPLLKGESPTILNIEGAEQDSTVLSEAADDEITPLVDLACPNLLLTSILMTTYQHIQHRLLLILPATHHPLSFAANEFLIMCVFRAITGCWLIPGKLLTDAKAAIYFTEEWKWSQIFATAFLDKFEEVVCQREQLVSVGLKGIIGKITAARREVWPVWSCREDKTKEFVEEHWGWHTVVALCAEGAG
ncbi:hypothetical protein MMC17_000741 [Xylographa soralifera]|nr:hypothetical protein [Xylographa soralifera]